MNKVKIYCLAILIGIASPVNAQDTTLEDMRQEVAQLSQMLQQLRTELLETGNGGVPQEQVGTVLQRLDALELQMGQLTGRIEEAQHRVTQIAEDGTRRIGDLEFRLTELEGGDTSLLGTTPTLGQTGQNDGPELLNNEQSSFNQAMAQLNEGNFQGAAEMFNNFIATYPGGPLTSEAQFRRGRALAGMQDWGGAARSFLDGFSGEPNGPWAAESLYELSASLGQLQQTEQACLTLAEINNRYPDKAAEMADKIAGLRQSLSCL